MEEDVKTPILTLEELEAQREAIKKETTPKIPLMTTASPKKSFKEVIADLYTNAGLILGFIVFMFSLGILFGFITYTAVGISQMLNKIKLAFPKKDNNAIK